MTLVEISKKPTTPNKVDTTEIRKVFLSGPVLYDPWEALLHAWILSGAYKTPTDEQDQLQCLSTPVIWG